MKALEKFLENYIETMENNAENLFEENRIIIHLGLKHQIDFFKQKSQELFSFEYNAFLASEMLEALEKSHETDANKFIKYYVNDVLKKKLQKPIEVTDNQIQNACNVLERNLIIKFIDTMLFDYLD